MVFAIQSEESVMRGLKLMKISQVVYFVLFVMLVAVCILLNLADGALKDIHSEFRDRWFAPALLQKTAHIPRGTDWSRTSSAETHRVHRPNPSLNAILSDFVFGCRPALRLERESVEPTFCRGLDDTACMAKYEREGLDAIEEQLQILTLLVLGACIFVLVTTYFARPEQNPRPAVCGAHS